MTVDEKAKKFDEIQALLWDMALHAGLLQASIAAGLIRTLSIEGPDGQEPDDA